MMDDRDRQMIGLAPNCQVFKVALVREKKTVMESWRE